ncbi:MAG: esterase/lipase family protein [Candidatus Hodarchaeales archaeon]|jgi:triacylglycerol lipase
MKKQSTNFTFKELQLKSIIEAVFIVLILFQISPFVTCIQINATVSKAASQNHNPVLFCHGWTCNASVWKTMIDWFIADGWSSIILYAKNFPDNSNCSTAANINNANKIKEWVENILTETGTEKIDLVGHSMGGLSSRYYIKFLGGIDKVDDYVSLGSPHQGNAGNIGCVLQQGSLLTSLREGDETPRGILNDTSGDHITGNISYTSIYSDSDEIVPYFYSKLDGANNIKVKDIKHASLLTNETVYELVRAAVDGTFQEGNATGYNSFIIPTVALIVSIFLMKKK